MTKVMKVMKHFKMGAVGLFLLSLNVSFSTTLAVASANEENAVHFRLWSEFEKWDSLKKKLPALGKLPVTLHIAIPQNEVEGTDFQTNAHFQELVALLKDAKDNHVSVYLWPLLGKKEGYWLNQWNANIFTQYVLRLKDRLRSEDAAFDGVSLDIELHTDKMHEYGELAKKLKLGTLSKKFKASQDPKQFQESLTIIQNLCSLLRSEGIRTHAVTLPFVLDDFTHSHSKKPVFLQHLLGLPVPYGYVDDLSVMSYRSVYQVASGKMNSQMVYDHALQSRKVFAHASIDVGIIGDMGGSPGAPMQLKGFQNPEELRKDVIAARAAGVHHIGIYALDGMDDVDVWLRQDFTPKSPKKSLKWTVIQNLTSALYGLLSL